MRRIAFSAALLILVSAHSALGGGCVAADPALSTVTILPPPAGCQYVFNPDGSLAGISATVVLLDAGGAPIAGAVVGATLSGVAGAGNMKPCPIGGEATDITDAAGVAELTVDRACGCGAFTLGFLSFCEGDVTTIRALGVFGPFAGTSPDLNGSCNIPGAPPVNVVDLGIWAGCLGAFGLCCDYDCDGIIGVIDLGIWASGLLTSCF